MEKLQIPGEWRTDEVLAKYVSKARPVRLTLYRLLAIFIFNQAKVAYYRRSLTKAYTILTNSAKEAACHTAVTCVMMIPCWFI
jgi:hypothetical protein